MEAAATPVPLRVDLSDASQVISNSTISKREESKREGAKRARASDSVELPRQRLSGATLAALATLAGAGAIGLGLWAFVATVRSEDSGVATQASSSEGAAQAISLLSRPSTRRLPLEGTGGRIVLAVGPRGRGVLVLDGLGIAPVGMSYQAWVVKPKTRAVSAAVFAGDETIVPLGAPVERGSILAVALERTGGVPAPTKTLRLVARRRA
ncbi:MAG: anti-sigma factor [Gaiellaceae bacterium]